MAAKRMCAPRAPRRRGRSGSNGWWSGWKPGRERRSRSLPMRLFLAGVPLRSMLPTPPGSSPWCASSRRRWDRARRCATVRRLDARRSHHLGPLAVAVAITAIIAIALGVGCRDPERGAEPQAQPAPVAETALEYAGSTRCASCHATETERWHGSDHDRAMEEANAATVLGDFAGASLDHFGVVSRFERRGDRFIVNDRGRGRRAPRLRGGVHLRLRAAPAVSGAPAGRQDAGAVAGVGRASARRGRPALVRSERRRAGAARRRAALDAAVAQLERALCRVPFDEPAQRLRRREEHLCDDLVRDRRRLRSVSRTGFTPPRVGRCRRARREELDTGELRSRRTARRRRRGEVGARRGCTDRTSRAAAQRTRGIRDLRALSRAPRDAARGAPSRRAAARHASARVAGAGSLRSRRPDAR